MRHLLLPILLLAWLALPGRGFAQAVSDSLMRRHLTIHRNPQLEEKKRNNSPEVKGNHHESGKLL